MRILGVILARAGSKGLPDKCVRTLLGRPVITYAFEHARASKLLTDVVFSTDSEAAKAIAREAGIEVIDRPAELASDTATVDAAARHAVVEWERRHQSHEATKPRSHEGTSPGTTARVDAVMLLYGNIPVRRAGLIDEAIEKLIQCGADSVRSVAPVTKQHPDWVHRLDGDRMTQFRTNSIYRRQDLEPLYYHDGAIAVVTRAALFGALETPDDHQSFLGRDRRAIVCKPEDAVDIDGPIDLYLAEAVLRESYEATKPRSHEGNQANCQLPIANCQLESEYGVRIGNRLIGSRGRVFIVAEAGVNHNGNVETALRMVDAAADAGADAVKFQMFRAAELASAQAPTAAYQQEHCGAKSQRNMLAKLELTAGDFERIARRCEEVGVALVITPFGVQDVVRIEKLNDPSGQRVGMDGQASGGPPVVGRPEHCASRDQCSQSPGAAGTFGIGTRNSSTQSSNTPVAAIKIASTDLTTGPLLDRAAATGMSLIVSTGAATAEEIGESVERLILGGARDRLILLHCVSCYPTPEASVNLRAIGELRRRFHVPVGLSDHSTAMEMGGWAVAAGACVLEKHFTLDRSASGPDHAMSLTPSQLAEYVRQARAVEAAMGSGELGMIEAEGGVRAVARKSVVAAVSIPAGTRITSDMLTLKRPGTGIPPSELSTVAGREAKVDISADAILTWAMVR